MADSLAVETALVLKDVLDRMELPPVSQIPGPAEVAEQELRKWTIPHTEIVLVKPRAKQAWREAQPKIENAKLGLKRFAQRVRDEYRKGHDGK